MQTNLLITVRVLLLLCYLFAPNYMQGKSGISFHKNFDYNAYSPKGQMVGTQNFSIVQDNRGLMYVANGGGVLEYDGVSWRLIPCGYVYSLAASPDGMVYVGTSGKFGMLLPDSTGLLDFVDLSDTLQKQDIDFKRILYIQFFEDAVYFMSHDQLFELKNGAIKNWPSDNRFFSLFSHPSGVFVLALNEGLKQLVGDSLYRVMSAEAFQNDKLYGMIQMDNEELLFRSKSAFYKARSRTVNGGSGQTMLQIDTIFPILSESDELLNRSNVVGATRISKHLIAYGTTKTGVVLVNNELEVMQVLNKSNGLIDNYLMSMYLDHDDMLWLGFNNGLSRVDVNQPIQYYNSLSGLEGSIRALEEYQQTLYAATSNGLYAYRKTDGQYHFVQEKSIPKEVWSLLALEDRLLVGMAGGLYEMHNGQTNLLLDGPICRTLHQSKLSKDAIFYGTREGLFHFKLPPAMRANAQVKASPPDHLWKSYIIKLRELTPGELWFETYQATIGKLNYALEDGPNILASVDSFPGLPQGETVLYDADSLILAGTSRGLFAYVNSNFQPSSILGEMQLSTIDNLVQNKDGHVLLTDYGKRVILAFKEQGAYRLDTSAFKLLSNPIIKSSFASSNGNFWLGSNDMLYSFDPAQTRNNESHFTVQIRKVAIDKDSVLFWGVHANAAGMPVATQPKDKIPILTYDFNDIAFDVAATSYQKEEAVKYQYLLEGRDEQWSDWTEKSYKEYTNLSEGSYRLHVRALNVYGQICEPAYYEFTITPPYYRTSIAYISYGLLTIGMFYGGVRLYSKKLRDDNLRLQAKINEATHEIRQQKEEIEHKNSEITSSIRYAQRIQAAILPQDEVIKEAFPDSFVLYKPRDIVSGDFYWFGEKNGKFIITAADCTGHGVPGAFVSMIGNTMLNKVINEQGLTDPGEILNHLHIEIKNALKQDDEGHGTKDGMDMALCVIDKQQQELMFGGAYNPVYIIRKNGEEVEEIRGNKFPVAGYHLKTERVFESQITSYQKGDCFYLFSDGYADQFGGPKGRKFNFKRFRELLLSIQDLPMKEQGKRIDYNIESWMANERQLDDIMVIGVRL